MRGTQEFISADDRVNFFRDIEASFSVKYDEDGATTNEGSNSWMEPLGLFFASSKRKTLSNLESLIEREDSGLSSEASSAVDERNTKLGQGEETKSRQTPLTFSGDKFLVSPFSPFTLRFRSKVLEQAFHVSGSYSYWIACQKMLVLAILVCLLNVERESRAVVEGSPYSFIPFSTYAPLQLKMVRWILTQLCNLVKMFSHLNLAVC